MKTTIKFFKSYFDNRQNEKFYPCEIKQQYCFAKFVKVTIGPFVWHALHFFTYCFT